MKITIVSLIIISAYCLCPGALRAECAAPGVILLSPPKGAHLPNKCTLAAHYWTFTWAAVPGALNYTIRIEDCDGGYHFAETVPPEYTSYNYYVNHYRPLHCISYWRVEAMVSCDCPPLGNVCYSSSSERRFYMQDCCGTDGGAGLAYVIVGDVSPDDKVCPIDKRPEHYWNVQRAVDKAALRLQDFGYTVNFAGLASPLPLPATKEELHTICRNPDVRAIALFCHGLGKEEIPMYGANYLMANGTFVTNEEIRQWRAAGNPLNDISLYVCNAGLDANTVPAWNIASFPTGAVIFASTLNSIIENKWEDAMKCPENQSIAYSHKTASFASESDSLGYLCLLCRSMSGESLEDIYGFMSGFAVRRIYPSGHVDYYDQGVGIRFDCYYSGQDSVILWAKRYRHTLGDTLPEHYICATAYWFGAYGADFQLAGDIELSYDEAYLQSLGMLHESDIRVWSYYDWFGGSSYVEVSDASIDTVNNVIRLQIPYSENSLLVVSLPNPTTHVTNEGPGLPLTLFANHPNPFNPSTTIEYFLPQSARVRLGIYDISGKLVEEIINEVQEEGEHRIIWGGAARQGAALASGVYLCNLRVGSQSLSRKIVLLK